MSTRTRPQALACAWLLSAACLLTACAAGPQPTPDPGALTAALAAAQALQPVPVPPPPNLLTPPPQLPPPRSGRLPDLETNHRQVAQLYHQLASQLCQLLQYLQAPTRGCPDSSTNNNGTPP